MRRSLSMLLASIVVFVTVYQMILPALTLELTEAKRTPGVYLEEGDLSTETHSEEAAEDNDYTSAQEDISDLTEDTDGEAAYLEETELAESGIDYSMIDDALHNEADTVVDQDNDEAEFFNDSITIHGSDGATVLEDEKSEYTYDRTEITAECGDDTIRLSYNAEARIPDGSVLTATRLLDEEAALLTASAEQAIRM